MSLKRFVVVRFFMALVMLFMLLTIIFWVMRILPGDPIEIMFSGASVPPEVVEEMRAKLGLNETLPTQFVRYFRDILTLNLGTSMTTNRPVLVLIQGALPASLELAIFTMAFSIPFGILLGITAARRSGTKLDVVITLVSLARWSVPVFWMGIILQMLFAVYIPIFPSYGRLDTALGLRGITGFHVLDSLLTGNLAALVSSIRHLVLPVVALGTIMGVQLAMLTRSNLIQVASQEFVRTERLAGLSERTIFSKHILPNALIPILTFAGLQFAILAGGLVVAELVFSWPGLGRLFMDAVTTRDFPTVQGCIIFIGIIVVVVNTAVDVLYGMIDPRVKY